MDRKKWQQVYQDLLAQIQSGKYPLGSRFPSVEELCRIYEPSNITIRRVCGELKKNGWITTRDRRGTYVTEPLKELTVYLCNRDFNEPPMFPVKRFEEVIRNYQAGMNVTIVPVTVKYAMENAESIRGPMVVFFSNFISVNGMNFKINHRRIAFFQEKFAPLVVGGSSETYGLHQIRTDRYTAFREAVRHLAGKGHQRIGYLSPMLNIPGELERFKGYLDGMAECGIMVDGELVRTMPREDNTFADGAVEGFLSMKNPPTALVCSSDRRALNVMACCRKRGVRIPEDLAVIGFDNIAESAESEPPLTTFAALPDEAGRYIMDYVKLYRIGQKTKLLNYEVEPQLIERGST